MKKRIGKISIVALLIMVSILMGISVFMQATTARTIKTAFIPQTGNIETAGDVWYVDGNRPNDGGAGTSWADAFQKLSTAMLISHNDIARSADRQWAGRNTIYVKADAITETLTALAQKTDIIGVGSNNGEKRPQITGDHTIPSTTSYPGCRFINIHFQGTGAAAEVMHIDTQSGIEFINCKIQGASSNTDGLKFEECQQFTVEDCVFYGSFSNAGLTVVEDTDGIYQCTVNNNRFIGVTAVGIDWNESESFNCWITDNYIYAVGITIDDDGDDTFCVNNVLLTDVDVDSYAEGTGWDFNPQLASGNSIMGSGGSDEVINAIPKTE